MKKLIMIAALFLSQVVMAQTAPSSPVTSGAGTVKFNALLQSWYVDDSTAASTAANQTFLLRRAELKFSGTVAPGTRWFVMVDPTKTPSATGDQKPIQDLGLGFSLTEKLELVAGQFKAPSVAESSETSPGELLMAERSRVARYYGERRDGGAMLVYKESVWKLSGMVSNGLDNANSSATTNNTANRTDQNRAKDYHVRADASLGNDLKLGVISSGGEYGNGTAATPTKGRQYLGQDLRYAHGPTNVNLTLVQGSDDTTDTSGTVVEAAYKITDKVQVAARYDAMTFSPAGAAHFNATSKGASLNYYLSGNNSKIQLSHFMLNNMNGGTGQYAPPTTLTERTDGSLTILAFQAQF